MNTKNVVLVLLIAGVLFGLAYYFINTNNKDINQEKSEEPVVIPEKIEENDTNFVADFNKIVTLKLNNQITFTNGLMVKLKKINDSRCPKDVQCIWAGELSGVLELFGGGILLSKEINLGTVNNKSIVLEGYTFILQNATENSITIVVQYEKMLVSTGPCYIGGCSSQICSDQKDVISTCEYLEKYACYKTAKCELQKTGKCGWTESPTLKMCLSK